MAYPALFLTIPTKAATARMRVWRALKAVGAATLRDGVSLLPDGPEHLQSLRNVATLAIEVGGSAEIYRLSGCDDAQEKALRDLFDRGTDYARLIEAIRAAPADGKEARALRKELAALSAIDYFPGEARRQAESALAALEAAATGEPANVAGRIRRLDKADYRGRTWATRKQPWVDRLASAWLIRCFIDPKASFLWLASPAKCPKAALGFDFDGAAFAHVAGRVTFEVLAISFGLDDDPAIVRLGAIVHHLDVGGIPVAEAAGIEAVLSGLQSAGIDDDRLLTEASRVFDSLYRNFSQENGNA